MNQQPKSSWLDRMLILLFVMILIFFVKLFMDMLSPIINSPKPF